MVTPSLASSVQLDFTFMERMLEGGIRKVRCYTGLNNIYLNSGAEGKKKKKYRKKKYRLTAVREVVDSLFTES